MTKTLHCFLHTKYLNSTRLGARLNLMNFIKQQKEKQVSNKKKVSAQTLVVRLLKEEQKPVEFI